MANNHSDYVIIDEPKPSALSHLAVNPLYILFAAILVPLFWMPPMGGRFWLPLAWLLFNGYVLGSTTWKKEWLICGAGGIAILLLLFVLGAVANAFMQAVPYVFIMINAVLFLTIYYAVFTQNSSYELFDYLRESGE